jgi:hypothetical protein
MRKGSEAKHVDVVLKGVEESRLERLACRVLGQLPRILNRKGEKS